MGEFTHLDVRLGRALDHIIAVRDLMRQGEELEESILLGDLIRREREAWGLSLQDLSSRCGLSKAHLWDMEQSRSINPTVEALSRLAEALRYPPSKLLAAALESRRVLAPTIKSEG